MLGCPCFAAEAKSGSPRGRSERCRFVLPSRIPSTPCPGWEGWAALEAKVLKTTASTPAHRALRHTRCPGRCAPPETAVTHPTARQLRREQGKPCRKADCSGLSLSFLLYLCIYPPVTFESHFFPAIAHTPSRRWLLYPSPPQRGKPSRLESHPQLYV